MNNLLREKMYLVQQLMDWPCPEMRILHHTDLFVNDLTVCIIMSRTAKILIDSWSQCIIDIIDVPLEIWLPSFYSQLRNSKRWRASGNYITKRKKNLNKSLFTKILDKL